MEDTTDEADENLVLAKTYRPQVRILGRDRTADASSGSSRERADDEKPKPVASAGFHDLPHTLMEMVANDKDNPREAARNLNSLVRANGGFHDSLENTLVGKFRAVRNDAGNLSKDL